MNKKFYIFIFIVVSVLIILSIKLFNIKDKTSLLFSSYHGFIIEEDTIVGYEGGGGNIVIPKMVNGVVVKRIGKHVFENMGIKSVVIPNNIIEIEEYAFANNEIISLNIPSSVEVLGEGSFIHNNISNIKIESNTIIGNACFNDNSLDYENAFFYKVINGEIDYSEIVSYGGKIRGNVAIPKTKENIELLTIGEKSFYDTGIIAVSIPNTVKNINSEAFSKNFLVEIYLSNNIENIAIDAFNENSYLSEVVIDNYDNSILNYPWGADKSNFHWLKK